MPCIDSNPGRCRASAISVCARAAATLCVIGLLLTMGGCAYVNPYISLNDPKVPRPPAPASMPAVANALIAIDTWSTKAESNQSEVTQLNRYLNLATFGLAAGAAIAPVYNAYKDLISALALGAGATYTANTLFTPASQGQLYRAAVEALTCVRQRGEGLYISMSPENSGPQLIDGFTTFLKSRPSACQFDPASVPLRTGFDSALLSMSRVEGSDVSAALKLRQAGQNVVNTLNREIDSRAPSSAAILAAAKSLAPLTTAASPAASDAAKARALISGLPGTCTPDDVELLKMQTAYYQKRRKALDDALDELDRLNSTCELNAPEIQDLALSQDAVTLVAGASSSIVVTGGRPPYTYVWDTTPPNTSIVLQRPTPDVFVVEGVSTIKNGTFKLTIRDSGASARTKVVTVTAKASS